MKKPRNLLVVDARKRKAGPHSGAKRPKGDLLPPCTIEEGRCTVCGSTKERVCLLPLSW